MSINENIFKVLPDAEEIESLIEKDSKIKINLANTEKPCFPLELEYISTFSQNINGINIELDACDYEELSYLEAFNKITYLRITLPKYDIDLELFDNFINWLQYADKLEAIAIKNLPVNYDLLFGISVSLSITKKFPVTLFILNEKHNRARKKKINDIHIPAISLLRAFIVEKICLEREEIKETRKKAQPLNKVDHSQYHYSGSLDISESQGIIESKLSLDIISLNIKLYDESIITFMGKNEIGKFTCEARCKWNKEENGFYFSSRNIINYSDQHLKNEFCSIRISEIYIKHNGECKLRGAWLQKPITFEFQGTLDREKDKKLFEQVQEETKNNSDKAVKIFTV